MTSFEERCEREDEEDRLLALIAARYPMPLTQNEANIITRYYARQDARLEVVR